MLNVFLDTNIIIDFLSNREPFYKDAAIIVSLGVNRKIKLHAAAMSFATTSYILSRNKENDVQMIKKIIGNFCKLCKVNIVDDDCVNFGVSSEFSDFEDAMQFRCAQKAKADIVVTRNTKDFEEATIPVYTPSEFLRKILEL